MKLILSPMAGLPGDPETTISVSGDVITIDGTAHDLSAIPEGGEAYDEDEGSPFIGKVTRVDGVLNLTVRVMLGDDAASHQPTDWAHWTVDAEGPVTIPALRKEVAE